MSIILKTGRERSIRNFHPWIFSGAIKKKPDSLNPGDIVEVLAESSEYLATGYFSSEGSISIKILTFIKEDIDFAFWVRRISAALEYRRFLGLIDSNSTNSFRLLNSEGDSVPGLIIDIYNKVAVIQVHSEGIRKKVTEITKALLEVMRERLKAIYLRDVASENNNKYLFGESSENIILENNLQFIVDSERGQKTGFFLDQRNNRNILKTLAKDRSVLNCFCYTGGFSLYAATGGAKEIVSIDSSKLALEQLEKNFAINDVHDAKNTLLQEDCFSYLEKANRKFDLIILDPPAFVKSKAALTQGLRAYQAINSLAFRLLNKNGILLTFSCSQLVTKEDYRKIVFQAASANKKQVSILDFLYQAPCHRISLYHPESEYLKGLILVAS